MILEMADGQNGACVALRDGQEGVRAGAPSGRWTIRPTKASYPLAAPHGSGEGHLLAGTGLHGTGCRIGSPKATRRPCLKEQADKILLVEGAQYQKRCRRTLGLHLPGAKRNRDLYN